MRPSRLQVWATLKNIEMIVGSGVFSSIISRFRKNDDSNPPSTSGSSRNLENISVDTATAEAATDIPRENGTVELVKKDKFYIKQPLLAREGSPYPENFSEFAEYN